MAGNGIRLSGVTGCTIEGCTIGTLLDGQTPAGNGSYGVLVTGNSADNLIALSPIAANTDGGIIVTLGSNGTGISQNRFFQNANGAIILAGSANGNIQPPTIQSYASNLATGSADPDGIVELFYDDPATASFQGDEFIGTATVDGVGDWSFSGTLNTARTLVATQTDDDNTSEFAGSPGTPFTVTVEQGIGQADPTADEPVIFRATFSQPIAPGTFTASSVQLGGTALPDTAQVFEVAPSDGTRFDILVSGMSATGIVTADIPFGAVMDDGGNPNEASTSVDNTVTFNFTAALAFSFDPDFVFEGAFNNSTTGQVTRNGSTAAELVVTLASDDITEATVPASVTIPAGQVSAPVTVTSVDDAILDGSQIATITGSAGGFADAVASITVRDDEITTITITDVTQDEGNSADTSDALFSFTVTRDNNFNTDVIGYFPLAGTATAGIDFDDTAGSITFPAGGALSMPIEITVFGDDDIEPDETFSVSLSPSSGALNFDPDDFAIGTITNDDIPPTSEVEIMASAPTLDEAAIAPVTYTVTRTGTIGDLAVQLSVAPTTTATPATDFNVVPAAVFPGRPPPSPPAPSLSRTAPPPPPLTSPSSMTPAPSPTKPSPS